MTVSHNKQNTFYCS